MVVSVACKKGAKCIITIDEKTILFDTDKNSTKADIILESGFFDRAIKPKKNQTYISNIEKPNATVLEKHQTITINSISIETIPAYKVDNILETDPKVYNGYLIKGKKSSIYIAGPTDLTPEMNLIECDIAVIPVAGIGMDVFEALAATNVIHAEKYIPIGYSENEKENEENKALFKKKCHYDTE